VTNPPTGTPVGTGEPSPVLAALLGFIPGVGAMYNGQYVKGIVHLVVFAVLCSLADTGNDIFGWFIAGWIFYMVFEAYHTACARRDGTPLPNPFGLNDLVDFNRTWTGFRPGSDAPYGATGKSKTATQSGASAPSADPYIPPYSTPFTQPVPPVHPMSANFDPNLPVYRRVPTGAIWLIGLGLLFLVQSTGVFHFYNIFHGRLFGPILLIGVGVWSFVHKMIGDGLGLENDGTDFYQWHLMRAVRSSFWMILVGVIWLLDALRILTWSRSWPLFMIAAGVMSLFRHTGFSGNAFHGTDAGYPVPRPAPPAPDTAIVPAREEHSGSDGEGR
jgi:TM2 domain-containing membrane protein YozV